MEYEILGKVYDLSKMENSNEHSKNNPRQRQKHSVGWRR